MTHPLLPSCQYLASLRSAHGDNVTFHGIIAFQCISAFSNALLLYNAPMLCNAPRCNPCCCEVWSRMSLRQTIIACMQYPNHIAAVDGAATAGAKDTAHYQ